MLKNPLLIAIALSPTAVAKLKPPMLVASALAPIAKAVPKMPFAVALAPGPMAMAIPVTVLVQSALLPIPQNEAQVALALGAPIPVLSRAAVNAPTAAAVVVRRELIAVPFVVGLVGSLLGALGSAGGLVVVVSGTALG
ncbi:hypothetical protein [Mycobacterium sp. M26]|uniref:hypothetical protein n=1 Tax=Mycobacterium sp. M26 TaxID=1762962 RepID=UPI0012E3985A|nr:hypothetical protein [Mycobacterium sp. M26]